MLVTILSMHEPPVANGRVTNEMRALIEKTIENVGERELLLYNGKGKEILTKAPVDPLGTAEDTRYLITLNAQRRNIVLRKPVLDATIVTKPLDGFKPCPSFCKDSFDVLCGFPRHRNIADDNNNPTREELQRKLVAYENCYQRFTRSVSGFSVSILVCYSNETLANVTTTVRGSFSKYLYNFSLCG
ncbi:hypothetical protein J6590_070247 [Homalodisca vitripennis]|nr:hypothetical protein J6590_070247 [Homalodisca vitripennis]